MKKAYENFILLLILILILIPLASFAKLVPCAGTPEDPCDFNAIILMIDSVIDFLLFKFAMPVAAILFAYAGFLFLTSGGSEDKRRKGKSIFWNALLGFVIALAAWLIVEAILLGLGIEKGYSLLEGVGK